MIAAAKAEGVRRIVYHSVMYPQIEAMPHHWKKLKVEEKIIRSGLPYTILQPASYMQNILPYWDAIASRGEYAIPYSVDAKFSPVDLNDVAEVAWQVLTDSHHNGAVYQLAGPERLSSRQIAEVMGKSFGREVRPTKQNLVEWKALATSRRMASYSKKALVKMFEYYDQHGFAGSSIVLERLLGRRATTFSQFLSRPDK